MDFKDKQVVVTGGAGALGTAVVGRLLDAGAICTVPCHSQEEADRFPLARHERVRLLADINLTGEAAVDSVYADLPSLWASIHIAGGFAMGTIAEIDRVKLQAMLDINFITCALSCRAAIAKMRMGKQGGRIVNVAARPALEPRLGNGMLAYTASKAAVAAFTAALSEEVADEGILVNAIVPSIIDTPANRASMPKADYTRWPKAEEIAATVAFLASTDNQVLRDGLAPVYGRS